MTSTTTKFVLDLDQRVLARLTNASSDATAERVAQTLRTRVRSNIISAGRVDTGRMLNATRVVDTGTGQREVVVDTDYAMFQERGIGPVYPKRAKVLRFSVGGKVVFARRTSGFEGAHFMRDAFNSLSQSDVNP